MNNERGDELEKRLREIIATHKGDLLSGLIRAARIGAEIEREECAALVLDDVPAWDYRSTAERIAGLIRARGGK